MGGKLSAPDRLLTHPDELGRLLIFRRPHDAEGESFFSSATNAQTALAVTSSLQKETLSAGPRPTD